VSTRAERRKGIATAIGTAFAAPVYADPVKTLLEATSLSTMAFAISRGVRSLDPSEEMGAVRQAMRELWEIYFLIPRTSTTVLTEDRADAVFELLQNTLAPTDGFKPTTDCGPLELKEEDVWFRDAFSGTIYYAIYGNDFWEG